MSNKSLAIFNIAYAHFLFEFQKGRCYLCGEPMPTKRKRNKNKSLRLSYPIREHVKPKSSGHGRWSNTLISHDKCSNLKGNRKPYPCELIYLEAANLALKEAGLEAPSYGPEA